MRRLLSLVLVAATLPAAEAAVWTAACTGQTAVQYQQIVGAEGYLHVKHGDGSYTTVKLQQSFFDGKTICGTVTAKVGGSDIATVCADNDAQTIKVIDAGQLAKGLKPATATVYCPAVVNVN